MIFPQKLIRLIILFVFCGCTTIFDTKPYNSQNTSSTVLVENHHSGDSNTRQTKNSELSQTSFPSTAGSGKIEKQAADIPGNTGNIPLLNIQPTLDEALNYCQASQEFWQKGELDNAIQALDQAYSLILNSDTNDEPMLIQQQEDLRFLISKRILEIYASRNTVVNGKHNAIPLILNKHVQTEIDRFAKGRDRSFFIDAYKRSGKYRPYIVEKLKEAGIPESLSWLPLIESGFKTGALSKARALGLWQFIPSTGYKFGLKRDMYIDERLDPVKSTKAAIEYLKALHQIFGDWTTVLAAYNCGEGRILRIIRDQNVNYLDNFWDLYERLPWETARYVPKFLATLHIVNNLEKYSLDSIVVDPQLEYQTVEVARQVYLNDLAIKLNMPSKKLIELNPELRYKILPNNSYKLKVPSGKAEILLTVINKIPVVSPPKRAFVYHKVKRGETLSTIARKYRATVVNIARANNINKKNYIVAGKLLKIPQRGSSYTQWKNFNTTINKNASQHVVKRGDSLWIIAKRYGTTTKKIQELNNLKTTNLHVGQVLKLPGFNNKTADGKTLRTYQVKRGDNPYTIAKQHNMPLNRFLRVNQLTSRSKIYPGQYLYIE